VTLAAAVRQKAQGPAISCCATPSVTGKRLVRQTAVVVADPAQPNARYSPRQEVVRPARDEVKHHDETETAPRAAARCAKRLPLIAASLRATASSQHAGVLK